jgi:hypothetical protein
MGAALTPRSRNRAWLAAAPKELVMSFVRPLAVAAALASLVAFTPSARAEAKKDWKIEDVTFTDADRLTTSNLEGSGFDVHGGLRPIRTLLTRPRTTFVPELLVSIQNL